MKDPGIEAFFASGESGIRATLDMEEACRGAGAVIIAVPTNFDEEDAVSGHESEEAEGASLPGEQEHRHKITEAAMMSRIAGARKRYIGKSEYHLSDFSNSISNLSDYSINLVCFFLHIV